MMSTKDNSSYRMVRRAGKQGARPSVDLVSRVRAEVEKNDIEHTENFSFKCNNKRCKTCPSLSLNPFVTSNVTNHTYPCINHETTAPSCCSQNIIYLLTCQSCNQQYVGETRIEMNRRMNIHRTAKAGCQHVIDHKASCHDSFFTYQILENLVGTGKNEIGDVDEEMSAKRKAIEDSWTKRLRTIYPYGLNEKAFDKVCDTSEFRAAVGKCFPPISRKHHRPPRTRTVKNSGNAISLEQFFQRLNTLYSENRKTLFNSVRILLNRLNRFLLKDIAAEILKPTQFATDLNKEQLFLFVLDIIDTKLYKTTPVKQKNHPKNVCVIPFVNKGIDLIHLPSIFHSKEVVDKLPEVLKTDDNIPTVTYSLLPPIRNKILNYKNTVTDLKIEYNTDGCTVEDLPECECHLSQFCDDTHKHIVTGDLRVIENVKLRKLLSKGPNYREPRTLDLKRSALSIKNSLEEFVTTLCTKYEFELQLLSDWKNKVLSKINDRVTALKRKVKFSICKPVLKDPNIVALISDLHSKFVFVPIDKASNNIAIICKRFYILKLISELGLNNIPSDTYKLSHFPAENIINRNIEFCSHFNLNVPDRLHALPFMYWMPKMHYQPSKARFILASATCSTKPLSRLVSIIFKKIFHQIESFHEKCLFYKNYNCFWVIENSEPVLERIKQLNKNNKAKSISTFDFSTLYTKLPHTDLVKVLSELIDFVFKGGRKDVNGSRKFLTVKNSSCFFTRKRHKGTSFDKTQIKLMIKHLICDSYFSVGNLVFKQCIGIPMGIDPAPFWANLYLYYFENKFITHLSRIERYRGFKFRNTFRFIDDACCINDEDEFLKSHGDIYPKELELKCEHRGNHATFLEIDISVKDGIFEYKLYDKRDGFPFHIVRMPDLSGNIPKHVFYGSISSEFLRIARATLKYCDFLHKGRELIVRMLKQGASTHKIFCKLGKMFESHPDAFASFGITFDTLQHDLKLLD